MEAFDGAEPLGIWIYTFGTGAGGRCLRAVLSKANACCRPAGIEPAAVCCFRGTFARDGCRTEAANGAACCEVQQKQRIPLIFMR